MTRTETTRIPRLGRLMAAISRLRDDGGRLWPSSRDQLVTALLSTCMVAGLYLDGWAHINLYQGRLGAFLTPWHGVLYAGFTATSVWILTRNQRLPRWSPDRVPAGYGLSIVGMAIATAGVAGDALWHTLFGVEEGVARLLAPFHLVLFSGAALVIAAPLRAELGRNRVEVLGLRRFAPALVSLSALTALVAFVLQFATPFVSWSPQNVQGLAASTPFENTAQVDAVVSVVIGGSVLIVPLLLAHRRFRAPFGTGAVLLGSVVTALAALNSLHHAWMAVVALGAGLAADVCVRRLRPVLGTLWTHRLVAVLTPVALWSGWFAVDLVLHRHGSLEMALGSLALAAGAGLLVSHLMLPGEAEWVTGRSRGLTGDHMVTYDPARG